MSGSLQKSSEIADSLTVVHEISVQGSAALPVRWCLHLARVCSSFVAALLKLQYFREQMGIRANGNLATKKLLNSSRANGNSSKWESGVEMFEIRGFIVEI